MFFEIDGNKFATESEANKYAVAHDLVILEFFAEGDGFVADYENRVDD